MGFLRYFTTPSIKAKTILLFAMLIAVSLLSSSLVMKRIQEIGRVTEVQRENIAKQAQLLEHQSLLIRKQHEITQRVQRINEIELSFHELQYWYFLAALTSQSDALDKAHQVEKVLDQKLQALQKLDPAQESALKKARQPLDRYLTFSEKMVNFYDDGMLLMGKAVAQAGEGQSKKFQDSLNHIREGYMGQQENLGQGVLSAGEQVKGAAGDVGNGGQAIARTVAQADRTSTTLMLLLTIMAAVFGWGFLRSVLTPIRKVGATIGEIEATNDLRRQLQYRGRDELRVITQAFDSMLGKFCELIRGLGDSTRILGEVAADSEKGSTLLSEQVQRQQSETSLVATATTEMSAAAQEVRQSTEAAAELADQVSTLTREGHGAVKESVDAIEGLASRIENASDVINELARRAESIGSVLDVIRGISEQTNLLALNAAIEAARAGESGRGFAVVADEVRGLAQRTSASTTEIQEVVSSLQADAQRAVAEIGHSLEESQDTVNYIARCRQTLLDIDTAAQQMQKLNQQVAQASAEQSDAIVSIDRNLSNLTDQVGEISRHAQETQAMSYRLIGVSTELEGAIAEFRY